MPNEETNKNMPALRAIQLTETNPQGYPLYPVKDTIYQKDKENTTIGPNNIMKSKMSIPECSENEKAFREDISEDYLDIPSPKMNDTDKMQDSREEENEHDNIGDDPLHLPEADNGG